MGIATHSSPPGGQTIDPCLKLVLNHQLSNIDIVFQAAMAPFTVSASNLIPIHVLGKPVVGELKRPWAPPKGMFDDLQKQMAEANGETAKTKKQEKKENKAKFIEKQAKKKAVHLD